MSYIDDTLMKGEIVLYRTRPHWIVFLPPFLWLVITIALLIYGHRFNAASFYLAPHLPIYKVAVAITLFFTVISAISSYINFRTSEYGITNKRVLMKIGFIRRLSMEIFLHRIEGVKVYQGVLGRILGYGSIVISGIGGSKDPFANIPNPLKFRQKMQEQIETLPMGNIK